MPLNDPSQSDAGTGTQAQGGTLIPPDTNVAWADLLLTDLGIDPTTTPNGVLDILNWMASENSPDGSTWTGTAGANNPLNNGLGSGGGSGLGSYPDLTAAASFAAQELEGINGSGLTGGTAVIADLQSNADPSQFATDIENTNWAGSHYGYGTKWHTSGEPTVTAAASAAAGASSPVVVGSGTTVLAQPATPGGSGGGSGGGNGGSSSAVQGSATPLQGPANLLQGLDNLMNPASPGALETILSLGTANVSQIAQVIAFRGFFVLGFAMVTYLGFKTLTSPGSTSVLDRLENQQTESRLRGQAATSALGEKRRSLVAGILPVAEDAAVVA